MASVDDYRTEILEAKSAGAPVTGIAKALGFSPSTVYNAINRWQRPDRPSPGEDALEALRRLVED